LISHAKLECETSGIMRVVFFLTFIYIYIYIRVCVCVCMYACKIIIHPNIFDEIGRESKLQWSICLGKQAFKTK
jgi:hypothetical protein